MPFGGQLGLTKCRSDSWFAAEQAIDARISFPRQHGSAAWPNGPPAPVWQLNGCRGRGRPSSGPNWSTQEMGIYIGGAQFSPIRASRSSWAAKRALPFSWKSVVRITNRKVSSLLRLLLLLLLRLLTLAPALDRTLLFAGLIICG